MTIEARPAAMGGPFGVAAMLASIESEHPHILGPMGFGFHDDGDVVAGLYPGQRAFVRTVLPILGKDFVDGNGMGAS